MRQRTDDGFALVYTRAERLSDAAVHVIGVIFALMAVPVLVTLALLWHGDRTTILAATVYGASLIAMLACSALYHMTPASQWRGILRRMDHTMIYVKIAGTYTPFVVLTGAQAGPLLTGLWAAAIVGATLKILAPHRFRWIALGLYLGMGWAGLVVAGDLVVALTPGAFALMLIGGSLYTFGVVFFLWQTLPFHNTIWHVCVLAATTIFYVALVIQLSQIPGGG